jgi:PHS family inorganic phosphate transporter-like MFS transporter
MLGSACIGAEWSSTKSRGRMMSAIFLMQPIGQLCAYGAGLTALRWIPDDSRASIDMFWRYVIGIGTFPTLFALCFRLVMPESARWHFEVKRKYERRSNTGSTNEDDEIPEGTRSSRNADTSLANGVFKQFHISHLKAYLFDKRRNWISLVGTSMCWFFLDIVSRPDNFLDPCARLTSDRHSMGSVSVSKANTCVQDAHPADAVSIRQPRNSRQTVGTWATDLPRQFSLVACHVKCAVPNIRRHSQQ